MTDQPKAPPRELTFAAFREANVARCLKWHPAGIESWSPSDWLTAVTGELGELASLLKMRNRERDGLPGNKFSPSDKMVADEIADVLTYLDLLAAALRIDLGDAAVSKFNEVSERVGFPDRIVLAAPPSPAAPDAWSCKRCGCHAFNRSAKLGMPARECAKCHTIDDSAAPDDPLSHAWKSGYTQAKEERDIERMFCPHCNPCQHNGNEKCRAPAAPDADALPPMVLPPGCGERALTRVRAALAAGERPSDARVCHECGQPTAPERAVDEVARLRAILWEARPAIICQNLHHAKRDQHDSHERCPVEARLVAALREPK